MKKSSLHYVLSTFALTGFFAASALGQSTLITAVSPNSAAQGTAGLTVTFTLDSAATPPPPPADLLPDSVTIGTISGTSIAHPSQYSVTAVFAIPSSEAIGTKDAVVSFPSPFGTLAFTKVAGFTVTTMPNTPPAITSQPQSKTLRPGASATFSVTASGSTPLTYRWQKNSTNVASATNASYVIDSATTSDAGSYRCIVTNAYGAATSSVAVLTVSTNVANLAADDAADVAYNAGWTNGSNGGSGFGPWQLAASGSGGPFTGSSAGNAGGGSGNIDTSGRSWGLWSTNGVTEAVRSLTGGTLITTQIFKVKFDNGYITTGRSVGLALQNSAGSNVWEFYFSGGESTYAVHDGSSSRSSGVPYTGDGLIIEFQPKGSGSYLALITDASGTVYSVSGSLISQSDQEVARLRIWDYEAGAESDYDLYVNSLSVRTGELTYDASALRYPLVETGQTNCYNNSSQIAAPAIGEAFYGQDAQFPKTQFNFTDNGDGTVTDHNTGLTWQQTPSSTRVSWNEAVTYCNSLELGGQSDWRMPTLKELYSMSDFSQGWPYLNTNYFGISGATVSKDEQYWADNHYIGVTVEGGSDSAFGVNHGTGHIKAYPAAITGPMAKLVRAVRGNSYGANQFEANGDGTISDKATGLMWSQADSGKAMDWEHALAWAQTMNTSNYLGYSDWRLPNVKELQSIVDYTRSPNATNAASVGPAINPLFNCTAIINEGGASDYPYYWSSTSARFEAGGAFYYAWYVAFGMAVNTNGSDFHGAGAVRFDTKVQGGPAGEGGERYTNYVRLVRTDVATSRSYAVVDTSQVKCYNDTTNITPPAAGQPFYGQDAQNAGIQPNYTLSGDGLTVLDNRTGLTWQRSPDTTGDTTLNASDKLSWANAQLRAAYCNSINYGGFSDWRLPSIKELYSLMDFRGTDPSGIEGTDTTGLTPFIDTNYFLFAYGDTASGERIIDSQYASSNLYVSTVDEQLLFGVNFADGRIKGYGLVLMGSAKTFFVQLVRGNPSCGINDFADNGDQTITDHATGLMWSKADSGTGMNWSNALTWVQARNAVNYLGHSDWRLPNVKELQSIVDYSRSPDTTGSGAIDPIFTCTQITNEEYQLDYPWYWSGTTHAQSSGSATFAAYVCFGRSLGYANGVWTDIHGAGCQRSDPKGSLAGFTQQDNGYYHSIAPQGDSVRCFNYVRLVRDADADVGTGPVAGFTASPTTGGALLVVTLTDTSTGTITNRFWSFGDGDTTNTVATSLTHTYRFPGTNAVSLTVSGPLGSSTTNQQIIATSVDTVGDGIPDWWRAQHFGGDGKTTNDQSCASCDSDEDDFNNDQEYSADTTPTDASSFLGLIGVSPQANGMQISWTGGTRATQILEYRHRLVDTGDTWVALLTNIPPTEITNRLIHVVDTAVTSCFYRIKAWK